MQMAQEKIDKFHQICDRHDGFSFEVVNKWTSQNKSLAEITDNANDLVKLDEEVFDKQKVTHSGFASELPARLTKERYIRIYGKIFATLRHDFYMCLKEFYKGDKLQNIKDISPEAFQ